MQSPPLCTRIDGWSCPSCGAEQPDPDPVCHSCGAPVRWGGTPIYCLGEQTYKKASPPGELVGWCKKCGAKTKLRADHQLVAIEGGTYNLGWHDYRPKMGKWQHEEVEDLPGEWSDR